MDTTSNIYVSTQGFYESGDAYDKLSSDSVYNIDNTNSTLTNEDGKFTIRKPIDQNRQFLTFKDNEVRIVKGDDILISLSLLNSFQQVDEYLATDIILSPMDLTESTGGTVIEKLDSMITTDFTMDNNFLDLSAVTIKDYNSVVILPQFQYLTESISETFGFYIFNGVEWKFMHNFFMFSGHDVITNLFIGNYLQENLKFKILLLK